MKHGKRMRWLLAATLLLSGCRNFWVSANNTCTTNCSTISSSVFYVLNSNAGQVEIAGFSIVNGTLTPLTGSPYGLPWPYSITVAPNNKFLYVGTQAGIYLYTIGSGGVLTLSSAVPIFRDLAAYTMQVDSTNSWLVEASGLRNSLCDPHQFYHRRSHRQCATGYPSRHRPSSVGYLS